MIICCALKLMAMMLLSSPTAAPSSKVPKTRRQQKGFTPAILAANRSALNHPPRSLHASTGTFSNTSRNFPAPHHHSDSFQGQQGGLCGFSLLFRYKL